jgi:hypothetical protein
VSRDEATPAGETDGATADATPHDLDRRPAVSPLDLPRLIGGVLTDIRAIAEGMAVLPALLTTLQGIERKVETLDEEVRRMRAGVDGMEGDVDSMKASLERVEPHLEGVSRITRPLRSLNDRARRRGPDAES